MVDKWVKRTAAEYAVGFNNLLPTGPAWPRSSNTALQGVVLGLSGIWGDPVERLAALLLTGDSDPRKTNVLLPDWERAWGLPDLCIPIPSSEVTVREANLVAKLTFLGAQSRAFFIAQAVAIGQSITIREYAPYMCGVSRTGDTSNLNSDLPGNISAATSAGTATSSKVLTFATLNPSIFEGMWVFDVTKSVTVGVVKSTDHNSNTLTMVANAANAVDSGDTLLFSNRMRWQLGPVTNRFYWTVRVTGLLSNWGGADLHCLLHRWKPAHTEVIFDFAPLQHLIGNRPWNSGYAGIL